MKRLKLYGTLALITAGLLTACGGGGESPTQEDTGAEAAPIYTPKPKPSPLGTGPIKEEVTLGEINAELATEGEAVFTQMCIACHKMDKKHVGPALAGVIDRRNPTWVMNMILDPETMVKEDPVAKELFAEYLSPMANQNLTEDQARAVLEYFRKYDQENPK